MSDASQLTNAIADLLAAVTKITAAASTPVERPEYATAVALGISRRTLRRLVRDGDVPGYLVGREIHVRRVDWDAWIARRKVPPRDAAAIRGTSGATTGDEQLDRLIASGAARSADA